MLSILAGPSGAKGFKMVLIGNNGHPCAQDQYDWQVQNGNLLCHRQLLFTQVLKDNDQSQVTDLSMKRQNFISLHKSLLTDLSTRKQWFTSNVLWSSTLVTYLHSHWWDMNIWRWRTPMRQSSHTGKKYNAQHCPFKMTKFQNRQAIEVNRRDYRAWYGLGQTYEILKMPFYCLYYYKQVLW